MAPHYSSMSVSKTLACNYGGDYGQIMCSYDVLLGVPKTIIHVHMLNYSVSKLGHWVSHKSIAALL